MIACSSLCFRERKENRSEVVLKGLSLKNTSLVGQWQVKAFKLEPGQRVNDPGKGGIIDADGEVLARGSGTYRSGKQSDPMAYGPPIRMTVDQGLATIFAPLPPSAWASGL